MDDNSVEGAIRQGVGRVQDAYGGATGDLSEQAKGKLNQAAGAAQRFYGQAADQARDIFGNTDAFVSNQPYAAIGVGVMLGLIVGLLLGSSGGRTVYVRD